MVNDKYSCFLFVKILIISYFLVSNNPSISIVENTDNVQEHQVIIEENGI